MRFHCDRVRTEDIDQDARPATCDEDLHAMLQVKRAISEQSPRPLEIRIGYDTEIVESSRDRVDPQGSQPPISACEGSSRNVEPKSGPVNFLGLLIGHDPNFDEEETMLQQAPIPAFRRADKL